VNDPSLGRAKAIALRYLAGRARTAAQVRDRLEKAGEGERADEVVAWLEGLRYLDDGAFARMRARSLLAPGRLGPRLAARRLEAAGIPAAEARAAIASALADAGEEEAALCRTLALKRTRGVDPASLDDRDRRRLARFLLGRGFAGPVVARVVGAYEDG
jgi:regulatory protein